MNGKRLWVCKKRQQSFLCLILVPKLERVRQDDFEVKEVAKYQTIIYTHKLKKKKKNFPSRCFRRQPQYRALNEAKVALTYLKWVLKIFYISHKKTLFVFKLILTSSDVITYVQRI